MRKNRWSRPCQATAGDRAEPEPASGGSRVTGHEDGYSGPARLTTGKAAFDVQVEFRGHSEPIDGRYHWYGRIVKDEALTAALRGLKATAVIQTPQGNAQCEVGEPDMWDRYRVTGYSTPPFSRPAHDVTRVRPPGPRTLSGC